MYRRIDVFFTGWKNESDCTLKVFATIPEHALPIKLRDNFRSLGRLAWHITQTLTEMPHKAGLMNSDALNGSTVPETMKEIMETYNLNNRNLIRINRKNLVLLTNPSPP